MRAKTQFTSILLPLALFFSGCTSEKGKVEKTVAEWKRSQIQQQAQKDAETAFESEWLRQGYRDFVAKNTEIEITKLDLESGTADVQLRAKVIKAVIRANLLGAASKVPADKVRNFNFSDGARLIQEQLGVTEMQTWGTPEPLKLQKSSSGWKVLD